MAPDSLASASDTNCGFSVLIFIYLQLQLFSSWLCGGKFRFWDYQISWNHFSCFLYNNTRYKQAVCCSELALKFLGTFFKFPHSFNSEGWDQSIWHLEVFCFQLTPLELDPSNLTRRDATACLTPCRTGEWNTGIKFDSEMQTHCLPDKGPQQVHQQQPSSGDRQLRIYVKDDRVYFSCHWCHFSAMTSDLNKCSKQTHCSGSLNWNYCNIYSVWI